MAALARWWCCWRSAESLRIRGIVSTASHWPCSIVGNENDMLFSSSRESNAADENEFILLEAGEFLKANQVGKWLWRYALDRRRHLLKAAKSLIFVFRNASLQHAIFKIKWN